MIIEYKKPYWVKYKWGLNKLDSETDIAKRDNIDLQNILYRDKFSIICDFKIKKEFIKDTKAGIFGKSGENFGLNFDSDIDSLVFEFRTKKDPVEFNCLIFEKINSNTVDEGVNFVMTKIDDTIMIYVNDKLAKYYTCDANFIDEYKNSPFFLGALNPGAANPKDRCFSQVDISLFSIVKNETNIRKLKKIDKKDKNVLCYYDFQTLNVRKDVFDESSNLNFCELVPKEYIL